MFSYWRHYLVNVYSLSPEWRFMAEKVPMQPRSRLSRPVFQVTKRGLKGKTKTLFSSPRLITDTFLFISVIAQRIWTASYCLSEVAQPWLETQRGEEGEALPFPMLCPHNFHSHNKFSFLPFFPLYFARLSLQVDLNLRQPYLYSWSAGITAPSNLPFLTVHILSSFPPSQWVPSSLMTHLAQTALP